MSPSIFKILPPATPVKGADVYLDPEASDPTGGVTGVVDIDAADDAREKGEAMAVDRRKGLDEAGWIGTGAGGGAIADV